MLFLLFTTSLHATDVPQQELQNFIDKLSQIQNQIYFLSENIIFPTSEITSSRPLHASTLDAINLSLNNIGDQIYNASK